MGIESTALSTPTTLPATNLRRKVNTPIALFAYARPEHTRRTLDALCRNNGFAESTVYAYCDGARTDKDAASVGEVRKLFRQAQANLPNLKLVERERNWGLARSVIDGVSTLTAEYGRVIVVEDDLEVAPNFLAFMNRALDQYCNDESVMQVSGHLFPGVSCQTTKGFFLPVTTTWGWATWYRAWALFDSKATATSAVLSDNTTRQCFDLMGGYPYSSLLKRQLDGRVSSWGILWYLTVFSNRGLVLYPPRSLVANHGFDGSGTHKSLLRGLEQKLSSGNPTIELPETPEIDVVALRKLISYHKSQRGIGTIAKRILHLVRWK